MSCSGTQHDDACGDRTQDLSIRIPTLYHYATAHDFYKLFYEKVVLKRHVLKDGKKIAYPDLKSSNLLSTIIKDQSAFGLVFFLVM